VQQFWLLLGLGMLLSLGVLVTVVD